MWFRIELNKDGTVASCAAVESSAGEAGGGVYFIEAQAPEEALRIASEAYQVRVGRSRRRYAIRILSGRCPGCGGERDESFVLCERCRSRARKRSRAVRAGEHDPEARPRARTPEQMAARELRRQGDERRRQSIAHLLQSTKRKQATLAEALAQFDALGPSMFREWLVTEIAKLGGQSPEVGMITARQLGQKLGVSMAAVVRLREEGLPSVRVGASIRYRLEDAVRWLDSRSPEAAE